MSKKEQIKRNHHKQPQFYLKGFATKCDCPTTPLEYARPDRSIWVYKKGEPFSENNPECKGISNVAFTKDFYAFKEDDGTTNYNKYEDLLEQQFEKPAKPIIEKIRRFEEISENEQIILSRYIASMKTRSDKWLEVFLNDVLRFTENDVENWNPNEFPNEHIEEIRKFVKDSFLGNKGKLHKESIIPVAEKIASILINMEWRFLLMPDKLNLFTSDNPVVYFNIDEVTGQLIFPVSSKIALSIIHKGFREPRNWKKLSSRYWKVDDRTVELIRNDVAVAAIKYVYFLERKEWIVDFINNKNNN